MDSRRLENMAWSNESGFLCNIQIVWSEFAINNMKAWIQLALYQWFRLVVVGSGEEDSCLGTHWPLSTNFVLFKRRSLPEYSCYKMCLRKWPVSFLCQVIHADYYYYFYCFYTVLQVYVNVWPKIIKLSESNQSVCNSMMLLQVLIRHTLYTYLLLYLLNWGSFTALTKPDITVWDYLRPVPFSLNHILSTYINPFTCDLKVTQPADNKILKPHVACTDTCDNDIFSNSPGSQIINRWDPACSAPC